MPQLSAAAVEAIQSSRRVVEEAVDQHRGGESTLRHVEGPTG